VIRRFFHLSLLGALALAGCGRAPTPVSQAKDSLSEAPETISPTGMAFRPEMRRLVSSEQIPLLEQIDRENVRVVSAALPSVVRIIASRPNDPRVKLFGNKIPFQLPFSPHGQMDADDTAYSSGVILSKDGYILTNDHAVADFTVFEVQLNDKRTFRARVMAADGMVDVAILKIAATGLAPLPWGDSDKVQVGEQVFAVGNPFDLDDSVSKGIVSAKGRNLPIPPASENPYERPEAPYQDYIQTDAAINPGNSGGALINIHGELIGLNAAIASTTRFNMGIGFAIPSNLVRYAVEGLFKAGHPVRGYLGVILPDSVDEGVESQLNLKSTQGALLADILHDSPAEKAKLHPFDFITAMDNHKIDSEADLRLVVAQIPIGKQVEVDFVREGKPQSTTVQITEIPRGDQDDLSETASDEEVVVSNAKETPGANVLSGLQVTDLNDKSRQKFDVGADISAGVIVNSVEEGSPADEKGIRKGDVIESVAINRGSAEPLGAAKDFTGLSGGLKPDQGVVLLVHDRERGNSFIYLAPPAK
jgi:serine protease Do